MTPKNLSIIGYPFTDFQSMIRQGDRFRAQKAKLITTYKLGDEMANTSVFLAALKLVNEFRKTISSNFNLAASGKIHVFTEIEFIDFENKRIDGMICIERGGKIIDAALLEMKNGRNSLDLDQINAYIEIADAYKIPKLITVSNQFVSNPTQSPLTISKKRNE